jgi:amidase
MGTPKRGWSFRNQLRSRARLGYTTRMAVFPEYPSYDAVGLAELVARGEIAPSELVEAAIARIGKLNPAINAVIHTMYARARECAKDTTEARTKAPLFGVPFLVKDLIQTIHGVPTTSGNRFQRGRIFVEEGTLYRRWRDAGLITLGKTNTPELGIFPITEPELFGPTRNPWNLGRTPGGSSGGSAAAVAAGIVPIASGGDGGGSIRIPASCCGLFGLKPSRGRMPMGPRASEGWNGFLAEHVLSRSVRDSAAVFDATHGTAPGAPYAAPALAGTMRAAAEREPGRLRIAFHFEPAMPGKVHPDCEAAVRDAARLLESLGHVVEERFPAHDAQALGKAFLTILAVSVAADVAQAERELGKVATSADFEVETWLAAMLGRSVTGLEHEEAIRTLQTETRRLARLYAGFDLVLAPTLGRPPIAIGELRPKGLEALSLRALVRSDSSFLLGRLNAIEVAIERVFDFCPFTQVANFTGQPSMSVPLHWNAEGLPIGVMMTGALGREDTLFALAGQLERARPWKSRRPPHHAD